MHYADDNVHYYALSLLPFGYISPCIQRRWISLDFLWVTDTQGLLLLSLVPLESLIFVISSLFISRGLLSVLPTNTLWW